MGAVTGTRLQPAFSKGSQLPAAGLFPALCIRNHLVALPARKRSDECRVKAAFHTTSRANRGPSLLRNVSQKSLSGLKRAHVSRLRSFASAKRWQRCQSLNADTSATLTHVKGIRSLSQGCLPDVALQENTVNHSAMPSIQLAPADGPKPAH